MIWPLKNDEDVCSPKAASSYICYLCTTPEPGAQYEY